MTDLPDILQNQTQKEAAWNHVKDAVAPAGAFSWRGGAGLNYNYYGARINNSSGVAVDIGEGTIALTASTISHIYFDVATATVKVSTTEPVSPNFWIATCTTNTTGLTGIPVDKRIISFMPVGLSPSLASGSALTVKDEGSNLSTAVTSLDFTGAGVTATAVGGAVTVAIAGGGGGSSLTVKDEGSNLSTAVTSIDFTGAGVTATAVGGAVTVAIAGGGGGGGGGIPVGSNVVPGVAFDTQDTNYGGYSVFNLISGGNIINLPNTFKLRYALYKSAGLNIDFGAIKILKTLIGDPNVISSTTVTIGGSATPSIVAVAGKNIIESDTISLPLSPLYDYWVVTYFPAQVGLNAGKKNVPFIGMFNSGYIAGNQTAISTIPISGLGSMSLQVLISHVLLLS